MTIPKPDKSKLGILLIDVQPFFVNIAFPKDDKKKESLLTRIEHLLMLAEGLDLPLIGTFERPISQNGNLPDRLEEVFPSQGQRFEKDYFNLTAEKPIREALEALPVKQYAVAGAETDVCVMQSVLGLLRMGYEVFLLEDCLFTTEPHPEPALRRMIQAGASPSSLKSLAYEIVERADSIPWYPHLWKEKELPDSKPFPKEFIPPEKWPTWELKW
jgi:nicotinamidase-related amidase